MFYKGCGGDPNRLHVTTGRNSDQSNWFAESNNGNNFTYTDIRIAGSTVTVLGVGSHA